MSNKFRTLFFWTLVITACAPTVPATEAPSRTSPSTVQPPTVVMIATTQAASNSAPQPPNPDAVTTVAPSNPQECAYRWAYQDLPELSGDFLVSIQGLQPEAQATAFAFGENCVHADESTTFLPMETDFNITLNVADLANESDLGEWIVKVMQIIEAIPADQIIGPMPGRVTLIFQSGGDQKAIQIHVDQYTALRSDLSSEEIYKALQTQ